MKKTFSNICNAGELFEDTNSTHEVNFSKIVGGLIAVGCGIFEDIRSVATDLLLINPDFKLAFHESIQLNNGKDEFLAFIAAAIGVAADAAIRHWGNSQEVIYKEFLDQMKVTTNCFTSNPLYSIMEQQQNSEKFPRQVYNDVLEVSKVIIR